jgi:hypothetical protein
MNNETAVLYISSEDLKELLDFHSKSLVGKMCKRIELFGDNPDIIKKEVKELIYESFRDVKTLIDSYNKGLTLTQFVFKTKGDSTDAK